MRRLLNLGAAALFAALWLWLGCAVAGEDAAPSAKLGEAREKLEIAKTEARLQRLALKEVQAAETALYIQQLDQERAASKAAADEAVARTAALLRDYAGRADDLAARRDLFNAQASYNLFIFLMVVAVVAAGLWFSFLQFTADRAPMADMRAIIEQLKTLPVDDPVRPLIVAKLDPAAKAAPHALDLGPIKITSNVIGLIVLAMSLAFFYLYLDRVYTIHEGAMNRDVPAATAGPAEAANAEAARALDKAPPAK